MSHKLTAALALAGALASSTALAATPPDQLVMAWNLDSISTFDPAEINEVVPSEMLRNICSSLTTFVSSDESKIEPAIAESWVVAEDGSSITFTLRDGLKFASGNPVTAEDVAYSFKRTLSLGLSNAGLLRDFGYTTDNMDEAFKALDARTFQLKINGSFPPSLVLMAVVTGRAGMVLDSKFLATKVENNDQANTFLKTNTACIGPYALRQWQAGEVVLLERNDNYWGPAPAMRRIIVRNVPEAGTQRLLLEKGDIDVARSIVSSDLPQIEAHSDLKIVTYLRPTLQYVAFNTARAPFDNPKVMEAMRWLVDYKALEATGMKNIGVQRNVIVPIGSFGALSAEEGRVYQLDFDKAKALLEEAGVKPGVETSIFLASDATSTLLAQHLASNAEKVGIKLNLVQMANNDLFSRFRGREFDSITSNWSASIPDANSLASRFVLNPDNSKEANHSGYPTWRSSWIDPAQNELTTAALKELDSAKREGMYHELQRMHLKNSPFMYMFQLQQNIAVRKEVTDFPAHAFGIFYGEIRK